MLNRIKIILEMIKFEHTIFALPFAFTGALLALGGLPSLEQAFWIIVGHGRGAVGGHGLQPLGGPGHRCREPADEDAGAAPGAGDAGAGPRVHHRLLGPAGAGGIHAEPARRSRSLPWRWLSCSSIPIPSASPSCPTRSWGWPLPARPMGAWIAVTGRFEFPALVLGVAVLFWLVGFDILYALQDMEFDRKAGLHSVPQRFGIRTSLLISRAGTSRDHALPFLAVRAPAGRHDSICWVFLSRWG